MSRRPKATTPLPPIRQPKLRALTVKPHGHPPEHRAMSYVDPTTAQERAEREAHATTMPMRPAYAHLINLCVAGEGRDHAEQQAHAIREVLWRGGWTDTEGNNLRTALRKWERRRDGKDNRYLLMGTRSGRLPQRLAGLKSILDTTDAVSELAATAVTSRDRHRP